MADLWGLRRPKEDPRWTQRGFIESVWRAHGSDGGGVRSGGNGRALPPCLRSPLKKGFTKNPENFFNRPRRLLDGTADEPLFWGAPLVAFAGRLIEISGQQLFSGPVQGRRREHASDQRPKRIVPRQITTE